MAKKKLLLKEKEINENIISEQEKKEEDPTVYVVTNHTVNLRYGPTKETKVLKVLLEGDRLVTTMSFLKKEWVHVHLQKMPEIEGYVMREYIEEGIA